MVRGKSSRLNPLIKSYLVARLFHAWLILLAVLWIAVPGSARAVTVQGIYRADVPVETQEQPDREQAFKAALETVLIKATGHRGIVRQPAVQALVNSASRYVQQFGYRDTEPMTLWVQFDGAALRAALIDATLPMWSDERPAVLVWLAVEHRGDRYLIDEDSGKPARKIIQEVAAQRGVPVLFPLLDIEDRTRVSVVDVMAGFDDALIEASERYAADAVVIARVTGLRDNFWRAQWQLQFGGQSLAWTLEGASLEAMLTDGMHAVADALGERLAVVESTRAQGALLMSVEGVDSLEDYARLQAYLDNLALVQDYRTYRVEPGYASFWLRLSGDPADVRRVIGLGDVLSEAPAPESASSEPDAVAARDEPPTLHFRLLR
jgi:hypothetical protein